MSHEQPSQVRVLLLLVVSLIAGMLVSTVLSAREATIAGATLTAPYVNDPS